MLKNLVVMGELEEIDPEVITAKDIRDEHIKEFIESKLTLDEDEEADPTIISNALKGIRMPMHIADPAARVTLYCRNSLSASKPLVTTRPHQKPE